MRLTNNWIHGDCLKELKKLPDESVDLIITSPPYHNLRVYSNDPCDLSNCEVSAKYSCGFSNLLDSSIIVNER